RFLLLLGQRCGGQKCECRGKQRATRYASSHRVPPECGSPVPPASLPAVSDISTPRCNRVAYDLANYRSGFVGASHAPVGVRRVVLQRCKGSDLVVARRKMADRIGGGGVAGERKGLAAAAAEIDVAAGAALARFFHPRCAAESVERRRILPDVGQRMISHRPEF